MKLLEISFLESSNKIIYSAIPDYESNTILYDPNPLYSQPCSEKCKIETQYPLLSIPIASLSLRFRLNSPGMRISFFNLYSLSSFTPMEKNSLCSYFVQPGIYDFTWLYHIPDATGYELVRSDEDQFFDVDQAVLSNPNDCVRWPNIGVFMGLRDGETESKVLYQFVFWTYGSSFPKSLLDVNFDITATGKLIISSDLLDFAAESQDDEESEGKKGGGGHVENIGSLKKKRISRKKRFLKSFSSSNNSNSTSSNLFPKVEISTKSENIPCSQVSAPKETNSQVVSTGIFSELKKTDSGIQSVAEDSPLFRATIAELEGKTEYLQKNLKKILKSAEALSRTYENIIVAEEEFAQDLDLVSSLSSITAYHRPMSDVIKKCRTQYINQFQTLVVEPLKMILLNDLDSFKQKVLLLSFHCRKKSLIWNQRFITKESKNF